MSENVPQDPQPAEGSATPPPGGYGQAPPPRGAYPGPEQGGFPPPPPPGPGPDGSYGPPGPGYGPPSDGEPQAVDSLGHGWRAFTANPWPFVVSQILWGLVLVVPVGLLLLAIGVLGAGRVDEDGDVSRGLAALFGFGGLLVVLVVALLAIVQVGAFATASLRAIAGERVTLADFFRPRNVLQLLVLAVIVGLASALLAITGIGPLIVGFFGIWSVFFVVDRGESATTAIASSVRFAIDNVAQTIVLVLLGYLLNVAGALACGVGTLVTNPVTMLAFADYYRRRSGAATPGRPVVG